MSTTPGRATRREWIGLAVIALPCLLYAMDLTVLTLAVPSLTRGPAPERDGAAVDRRHLRLPRRGLPDHDGHARRPHRAPPAAADRRRSRSGRRRCVAAFASSPEMLIASRALLGVAGATIAPSTLSLIRNMFADPRQRTVAIGDLGHELLRRRRDRAARRRRAARVLLVGLGVPARGAGDGAAARRSARGCCPSIAIPTPGGSICRARRCRWSRCSP